MIDDFIKLLEEKKEEIIRNSIELINIPSITYNRKSCTKALEMVVETARKNGLKASYTQKKDCGVVELGEGSETVGVLTHVDVVDVGDIKKWQSNPFKGDFDGKYITGRGAMDDKCPTAIILTILTVLNSLNLNYKRKIQFIIGTSEEEVWTDMESYKKEFPIPDCSFTPDGGFPIHNIEKGYGDIKLEFKIDRNSKLNLLKAGDSPNTIPSRGELRLDNVSKDEVERLLSIQKESDIEISVDKNRVKIRSIGKSTHSSLPQNGDNALIKLCRWIKNNKILDISFDRFLNFVLLMDRDYKGEKLGFDNSNCYFNENYIGETFINPTLLNYEGNKVKLNLNLRHKYGVELTDVKEILDELSEKYKFDYYINKENFLPPLFVDKKNTVFDLMNNAYKEVINQEGGFALAGGTSYAKALPNTVSWGPVFPGEEDTCHQENERMTIDSIMKCTEIYGRFLYKIAVKE